MAWNSGSFNNTVFSFLSNIESKPLSSISEVIGNAYNSASTTAMISTFPATPINLKGPGVIQSGFSQSFSDAFGEDEFQITPPIWTSAANSIISYWTGVTFSLVPPPGGAAGITNILINPGDINILINGIAAAFSSGNPGDAASILTDTCISHLATITGTWSGSTASVPPVPFVFPWVGLS